MAIVGTRGNNLQGLSTDTKPTEEIDNGMTFHEVNTGLQWVFHDGRWVEDLRLIYALSIALKG